MLDDVGDDPPVSELACGPRPFREGFARGRGSPERESGLRETPEAVADNPPVADFAEHFESFAFELEREFGIPLARREAAFSGQGKSLKFPVACVLTDLGGFEEEPAGEFPVPLRKSEKPFVGAGKAGHFVIAEFLKNADGPIEQSAPFVVAVLCPSDAPRRHHRTRVAVRESLAIRPGKNRVAVAARLLEIPADFPIAFHARDKQQPGLGSAGALGGPLQRIPEIEGVCGKLLEMAFGVGPDEVGGGVADELQVVTEVAFLQFLHPAGFL